VTDFRENGIEKWFYITFVVDFGIIGGDFWVQLPESLYQSYISQRVDGQTPLS
jgi:hypothetical protein